MAITVNELLNQWRAIEEENEDVDDCCSDSDDITVSSKINHIQQAKENWCLFSSFSMFLSSTS